MTLLTYKLFLEKAIMNTDVDIKYENLIKNLPMMKTLSNKFKFGNGSNCIEPITDKEKELDNNIKAKAKELFDSIYGTKYSQSEDTDIINSIDYNNIYSFDIIKGLLLQSYEKDVYSTLNIEPNNIYKYMMMLYIKNSIKADISNTIKQFINFIYSNKKMIKKDKFLHDFLMVHGSEFTFDIVKEVFSIKSKYKYEMGGSEKPMDSNTQKIFLNALKNTINKFNDVMFLDKFNDVFIKNLLLEFNNSDFKTVIDGYITKLNMEFIEKLKAAF